MSDAVHPHVETPQPLAEPAEHKPTNGSVTVKVRLKIGVVEVDYEGPVSILRNDILPLLKTPIAVPSMPPGPKPVPAVAVGSRQLTMIDVARKLNSKKGPELALAACARLTIVLNRPTYSLSEIGDQMKDATGIFTQSMRNNLPRSLKQLLAESKITRSSNNLYSLHHDIQNGIEQQLTK